MVVSLQWIECRLNTLQQTACKVTIPTSSIDPSPQELPTTMHPFRILLIAVLLSMESLFARAAAHAAQWSIPIMGNVFRTEPEVGRIGTHKDLLAWEDSAEVYSIFFRVDRPATLDLSLTARAPKDSSSMSLRYGKQSFKVILKGDKSKEHRVGQIHVPKAGYCRIDLKGMPKNGKISAELKDLIVVSATEGLQLDFVKTDDGQMFYWGRRGPSVHLSYELPRDLRIEYAYSEITVPLGQDPIGSYFMANGFAEGYFGIQVNSEKERRILFSVWSPFQTDNPKDIPPDQRIVPLDHGTDVKLGEFGNEGSGGQSYLIYPWRSDTTYKFLTQVKPDGQGNTVYASWFGEADSDAWRLVARFRRPKTNTSLVGFHSFLENFDPTRGHLERLGQHGNIWVRDTEERWHESTIANFSVDPTGKERHRLDYAGGADGGKFFLRNGGFFDESIAPGSAFQRTSTAGQMPIIDFKSLR